VSNPLEGYELPPNVLAALARREAMQATPDPGLMDEEERNRLFSSPERSEAPLSEEQDLFGNTRASLERMLAGPSTPPEHSGYEVTGQVKVQSTQRTIITLILETTTGKDPKELLKRALGDHKHVVHIEVVGSYRLG
jgi:hypothetical protein